MEYVYALAAIVFLLIRFPAIVDEPVSELAPQITARFKEMEAFLSTAVVQNSACRSAIRRVFQAILALARSQVPSSTRQALDEFKTKSSFAESEEAFLSKGAT